MEEFKIQLTYNPDHFREIYYKNGQGSIFTAKPFRNAILIPVVLIVIGAIIYFLSFRFPAISWLIALFVIAILGTTIYAIMTSIKYVWWKMATEAFLKELSQYRSYSIAVTDKAIEVAMDSKIEIEKWENLRSALIENDYILLWNQSKPAFIFPARSMKPEEFEDLKEIIKQKIMK